MDIASSPKKNTTWFILLFLLTCGVLIYSNILKYPFVFDDQVGIIDNGSIRNPGNYLTFSGILKPRAIVDLTFAMNYKFGQLSVFGYRTVNILIHIFSGFIVFFLVRIILERLSPSIRFLKELPPGNLNFSISMMSFLAAGIFISHPVQTQSVTYTVQRYTSIASFFYMASLFFFLKARLLSLRLTGCGEEQNFLTGAGNSHKKKKERGKKEKPGKNREGQDVAEIKDDKSKFLLTSLYILTVICSILAFLSKQNAASLPIALLMAEFLLIDRSVQGWKKKIPAIALTLLLWIIFVLFVSGLFAGKSTGIGVLEDVSSLTSDSKIVGRWSYLCTQFNVLVVYLRLMFLPAGQSLDHLYPFKAGFFDGLTPLAFLFLISILFIAFRVIKKYPVISFSIFWFFITLSVESSIFPIRDAMFEHRMYLPMMGFALLVSYLVFQLLSDKPLLLYSLSAVIILSLGITAHVRNYTWENSTALWSDVVLKNPGNYRAHNILGNSLLDAGKTKEAIEHFLKALKLKNNYSRAHNNMGNALKKANQKKKAVFHYSEALRILPNNDIMNYNIANALLEQGNVDEAIVFFTEALRLNPGFLSEKKQLQTAREYKRINKAFPPEDSDYDAETHYNLGFVLGLKRHFDMSIGHFKKAIIKKPDYAEAYNHLGVALTRLGRLDEAVKSFQKALAIKPDYLEAKNNLIKTQTAIK